MCVTEGLTLEGETAPQPPLAPGPSSLPTTSLHLAVTASGNEGPNLSFLLCGLSWLSIFPVPPILDEVILWTAVWQLPGCVTFSFPGGSDSKESACNAGDLGLIPGSGRSLGEGNGNPLQYSCLENPMDRGAWWATVYGITKSWTLTLFF